MLRLLPHIRSLPRPFIPFIPPKPCPNASPVPAIRFLAPFSSRRQKSSTGARAEEEAGEEAEKAVVSLFGRDPTRPPRLFVVQPRLRPDSLLDAKLAEALNLANSLEDQRDGLYAEEFSEKETPPHLLVQNPAARSRPHADTYFGKGTVENVKIHMRGLQSEDVMDAIFVNTILSGIQQRNLEVAWGKPVLDRVALIIEIFNAHAETKEAKLQSELAALMYKKSRLVRVRGPGGRLTFGSSGDSEVVSARGRGSGGRGFIGGAGETELQLQHRRIQERRSRLLEQIEAVRRTRALQRASRKKHVDLEGHGLATVAIVGYTNSGKSTLVGALSRSDLYSDDRLFATVDPRLRSVILPSRRKVLLSDTVGFISDLPVQLVEAFHATLEEVVEADLLVHVLDSSAPNLDDQRSTVMHVLQQIGVSEDKLQNMIEVWNKIDLLGGEGDSHNLLDEDEDIFEEEDGGDVSFSEEDDLDSDHSSCEAVEEDTNAFELSSGETFDVDDVSSDRSSIEHVDEGYIDGLSAVHEQHANFYGESQRKDIVGDDPKMAIVKTSAVMGIGLQQLLYCIDEKLRVQNTPDKNNFGPFDRKWRPSTKDVEKIAAQQ